VPAATPQPAPDGSSAARRPAQAAAPSDRTAGTPADSDQSERPGTPPDRDHALLAAPVLGGPEQSDILDWEWAALAHEEDPSVMYPCEDEPGDYEEWLDEISCALATPDAPAAAHTRLVGPAVGSGAAPPDPAAVAPSPPDLPDPQDFAVGGAADTMAPGPELAALADQVWKQDLSSLDDDQLTGVLQAANRLAAWSAALRAAAVSGLAAHRETAGRENGGLAAV
jgi:hypothetical protein